MELKDKVIAITGGASGLGEASTRHFVSQGAKVMILDINDDNAKAICDELGNDNVDEQYLAITKPQGTA